jgi:tetratricopeptide (TPR) repeat protein
LMVENARMAILITMRRIGRGFANLLFAGAMSLCAPPIAWAAPNESERVQFQEALQAFQQGRLASALESLTALLQANPDHADAHMLVAMVLDMQGEVVKAGDHFERAVQLRPDSAAARVNLGSNLIRRGEWPQAVAHFEKALELDPHNATASFNLGVIRLHTEGPEEAIGHFREAFRIQPEVFENGYQLAYCLVLLGEDDRAEEVLAEIRSEGEARLEFQLLYGLIERSRGRQANLERVLEELKAASLRIPVETLQSLANLLISRDLLAEAVYFVRRISEQIPDSQQAWAHLAWIEKEAGELPRARDAVRRALALGETEELHLLAGDILELMDDPVEAVGHYQEAVRLNPSERTYYALGHSFLLYWNWDAAAQVFETALRRFPESAALWTGMSVARFGGADYAAAQSAILGALRNDGADPALLHLLDQTLSAEPDLEEELLQRIEGLHRKGAVLPWSAYLHARSLFLGGRGGDEGLQLRALDMALWVAERFPDFFEGRLLLADIRFELQQWPEAIAEFRRVISLDPRHVQAHYRLALAEQRGGDRQEAARLMRRYQELKEIEDGEIGERMARTRSLIVETLPGREQ